MVLMQLALYLCTRHNFYFQIWYKSKLNTSLVMNCPQTLADILASDSPGDSQGLVTDVNAHFEQMTGWKKEEIIGELISVILPSYFRESHHMGFSRFTATGVSAILNHPLELKVITKDNQEIKLIGIYLSSYIP